MLWRICSFTLPLHFGCRMALYMKMNKQEQWYRPAHRIHQHAYRESVREGGRLIMMGGGRECEHRAEQEVRDEGEKRAARKRKRTEGETASKMNKWSKEWQQGKRQCRRRRRRWKRKVSNEVADGLPDSPRLWNTDSQTDDLVGWKGGGEEEWVV